MSESSRHEEEGRYLTYAIAGVAALGAAAVTALLVVGSGSEAPAPIDDSSTVRADDWPENADRSLRINFDSSEGPVWVRDGRDDLRLAPHSPENPVEWRQVDSPEGRRFLGTSRWNDTEIQYEWTFYNGDPQAQFSVRLPDVRLQTLREETISTSFRVPDERLRAMGRRFQLREATDAELPRRHGPLAPVWVQWRGPEDALTLTDWSGDGWTLRRNEGGESLRVELYLWRPELHPALQNCGPGEAESSPTVTLRADATVTFAEAPRLVSSPLPGGHAAAAIPIFDVPAAHPDAELAAAQPDSPEDWTARAKTLAYGHSDSSDPRYGNGGLLGHDLGGTIALPRDWADTEPVRRFVRATDGSDVDVALRGAGGVPDAGRNAPTVSQTIVSENASCDELVGSESTTPAVEIASFQPFRGTFDTESIYPGGRAVPASARPYRLDGSRSALVDSALASQRWETLLEHRSVATFATPLLGSRNPLVPAAREALLSPEREGQWTLASPFAEALASLSILRESKPVWVGSLSAMTQYWSGSRRTGTRWTSEGDLAIHTDRETPVRGFTLLVDGAHLDEGDISVDGVDDVHLRHGTAPTTRRDSPRQTWISWDNPPKETVRVDFDTESEAVGRMPPVLWSISN